MRPYTNGLLYTSRRSVWSAAGIGPRTNPISSVHRRPAAVSEAPLSWCMTCVVLLYMAVCRLAAADWRPFLLYSHWSMLM